MTTKGIEGKSGPACNPAGTRLHIHATQQLAYTAAEETYKGEPYVVVPVIMMVEGVHAGSRGPLFHSREVLSRQPERWNGVPVTVHHPQDDEGRFISAASLENCAVGELRNARWDNNKLRADAWLSVQRLVAASPEALHHIRTGIPLDVSIGVFSEQIDTTGEWNGETYTGIALNHQPDHLALLPGAQGACSWADGCGVRANKHQQNEKPMKQKEKESLKILNAQGYTFSLINNKAGMMERLQKIHEKLNSMDNEMRVYFLEELYDDELVYRVMHREQPGDKLYKQNYSISGATVELTGEPVEVRREVEYVTMQREKEDDTPNQSSNNLQTEGGKMSKEQTSPCLKAKVDGLISNKLSNFTEKDREWLEGQSEDILSKMTPNEPEKKEVQINREQALEALALKEEKDFLSIMPEEMKAKVEQGINAYQEKRDGVIANILKNTEEGVWTKDELKEFSTEKLEKIDKSVKQPADYSGAGAGNDGEGNFSTNKDESEEEPLYPAEVERESKTK